MEPTRPSSTSTPPNNAERSRACAAQVREALSALADPQSVSKKAGFFRAVPGGYGEGDRFLGVSVPNQRKIARRHYREADLACVDELLASEYHEVRLTALFMMVLSFEQTDEEDDRRGIYELYVSRIDRVDNWDLVDSSAPHILGAFLLSHPEERGLLDDWASSEHLFRVRAAVLATFTFIRGGRFEETLRLARRLIDHPHDLIHKAVGWMLREIGNRNSDVEYRFLDEYAGGMPRTMLRYAIEKFPQPVRTKYLST